jgi:hypothetical protein
MLTNTDNSIFNKLTNAILSFILPKRIKKLIYLSYLIAMILKNLFFVTNVFFGNTAVELSPAIWIPFCKFLN